MPRRSRRISSGGKPSGRRAFFGDADPAGYILFGRNCESREQLRTLTDELCAIHGRDRTFISIDQEGGRVARLKPPEWQAFPPGEVFARLWDVAPDGVQTLVTRAAYRLVAPESGEQKLSYHLYGNHWRFETGHELMLEVTGDDSTFFRRDNFPSTTTISAVKLTLPGEQ